MSRDILHCFCKQPPILKQVEEDVTNKGAFYYKCATETCKFFLWATDSCKSIDYGSLWAPCCFVHPNRKCKLLQTARNSPNRGKLFWCCGVLVNPCGFFKPFEGDIEEYKEFVPQFDESLLEIEEKEEEITPILMSLENERNEWVGGFPQDIMSLILDYIEMIPYWFKIIGVCKEWKRMIDNIIEEKVREGNVDLNLGFLKSDSPFSYFCEIFKRFYRVRMITICNFELYSELMRLLEWVGVETLILYNCSTKMSLNQKPSIENESIGTEKLTFSFRSLHTEMSFYHVYDDTLIYNFNPDHVNMIDHCKTLELYKKFTMKMREKVDFTRRRHFQELSQIIAINCSKPFYLVWLNGKSKSYHKHENLEANYGELIDLPFEKDMETIGKCHIDVFSLPVKDNVGFLQVSILGHRSKGSLLVKNSREYVYPIKIDEQRISNQEIQKQLITKSGIANYVDVNMVDMTNKSTVEVLANTGVLNFKDIFKNDSFKNSFECVKRELSYNFLNSFRLESDVVFLWNKKCVRIVVDFIHRMHSKGFFQCIQVPSTFLNASKLIDKEWIRKMSLFPPVSCFFVDYGNVGAIRVPFSWETFITTGQLRYLYEGLRTTVVQKNVHSRTSDQFEFLKQPKKRKM